MRALAPGGVDAVLDAAGTAEAVAASVALLKDPARAVTIVAGPETRASGFIAIGGGMSESKVFRDAVRPELIARAGAGELVIVGCLLLALLVEAARPLLPGRGLISR